MEWISIKDELPEEYQTILAYGNLDGCYEAEPNECLYTKARFMSVRHEVTIDNVSHWMPMPPAPNGIIKLKGFDNHFLHTKFTVKQNN